MRINWSIFTYQKMFSEKKNHSDSKIITLLNYLQSLILEYSNVIYFVLICSVQQRVKIYKHINKQMSNIKYLFMKLLYQQIYRGRPIIQVYTGYLYYEIDQTKFSVFFNFKFIIKQFVLHNYTIISLFHDLM